MQNFVFPVDDAESAFLRLGHLSAFELQISFLIYYVHQLYSLGKASLPCAAYTAASIIENLSFEKKLDTSAILSAKELEKLIGAVRADVDKLSGLYDSEVFKNLYLVRWVSMHIDNCYRTVTLTQLAKELNINSAYLCSAVSANTGCTFRSIVFYRRLISFVDFSLDEAACDLSLERIALELGYGSIHHFCKIIKQHLYITPSALRRDLLLLNSVLAGAL